MKYLTIVTLVILLAASCQSNESRSGKTDEPEVAAEYVLYEVQIEGMTCTGCEETIEGGVTKVEGVGMVEADFNDGTAQVKFIKGKTDTSSVRDVIEASGYKVLSIKEVDGSLMPE